MDYTLMKLIHIISSIILLAMGLAAGIYFWQNHKDTDLQARHLAISSALRTNWLFTTPALILQFFTGWSLMHSMSLGFTSTWINLTLMLYCITCLFWAAMMWLQIKMVSILKLAITHHRVSPLNDYNTYYQYWSYLAMPALFNIIIIFYLMIFKPA